MILDVAVSGNHKAKVCYGTYLYPVPENVQGDRYRGSDSGAVPVGQAGGVPVELVDGLDDLLQVLGFVNIALRALVDLADMTGTAFARAAGVPAYPSILRLRAGS